MRFDINDYKGNYAMHCKTEAEANEFCDYLHSIGKQWHRGSPYCNNTKWNTYKKETCYNFNENCYGDIEFYTLIDFTILEWSDFTTEFTKADLKDGMVVALACGAKCLVLNNRIMTRETFLLLDYYTDDLKHGTETINAVYKTNAYNLNDIFLKDYLTLIWERNPEPVEMTLAEVCKALGKEIKIVKE